MNELNGGDQMPTLVREREWKSQVGYQTGSGATYAEGGGDINYAVGQVIFVRYFIELPKNTTINSATITVNQVVKDGNTAQNSFHTIRAFANDDSPVLRPGTNEWGRVTTTTTASASWNPTWVVGAASNTSTVAVTSILQELVNRTGWKTGSYVTFTIECTNENGSDMGLRANNDFDISPTLDVNYTLPASLPYTSINYINNPEFDVSLNGLDSTWAVPGWYQNPHYGAYVDSANFGTVERDTGFMRIANTPTLKFTTVTPPTANDKATGVFCQPQGTDQTGTQYVTYCGWVFVPSTFTEQVSFEAVYFGGQTATVITARDQWVPFSTAAYNFSGDTNRYRYFSLRVAPPYTAGKSIWISEPCVMRSSWKQMPWNGSTVKPNITHRETSSNQIAVREIVSKRFVHDGTSAKAATTWGLNDYGLMYVNNNN